ncbi:hypothetical protein SeF2_070 [Salmonella phage SeF2]|nr:hypothetical protein SeF2_070 [Salmonella phage SeF2]WDS51623.1 hypothetical protein SeF6b_070 [Salmonella phage SeF6b]
MAARPPFFPPDIHGVHQCGLMCALCRIAALYGAA